MRIFFIARKNKIIDENFNLLINNVIEKDRIIKIKNRNSKYNSLISKLLLQYCFYNYYNYNIDHLSLKRTKYNKPFIEECDLYFNLSHSRDNIVLVFSEKPIGIDIESIDFFNYDIIKKFFSSKEKEYIYSFSNNKKKKLEYFKIWTQKESFVKCLGMGFFHSILNTNMVFNYMPIYKKSYKGTDYYFYTTYLNDKFIITLCSTYKIRDLHMIELYLEELIDFFI
ncbi:4'-phosphopantetheinyl transferase family protein [Staphylococcus pasteuri]